MTWTTSKHLKRLSATDDEVGTQSLQPFKTLPSATQADDEEPCDPRRATALRPSSTHHQRLRGTTRSTSRTATPPASLGTSLGVDLTDGSHRHIANGDTAEPSTALTLINNLVSKAPTPIRALRVGTRTNCRITHTPPLSPSFVYFILGTCPEKPPLRRFFRGRIFCAHPVFLQVSEHINLV